jgi:hypothetical protein
VRTYREDNGHCQGFVAGRECRTILLHANRHRQASRVLERARSRLDVVEYGSDAGVGLSCVSHFETVETQVQESGCRRVYKGLIPRSFALGIMRYA